MAIDGEKFKSLLSERFVKLLDSERGMQTKLAKTINKSPSFFSELKRGKPVNALHLKAVEILFGFQKLAEILSIDNNEVVQGSENNIRPVPIPERRVTQQNPREGILSLYKNRETARQMNLDMVEIEKLDHDQYLILTGEIRGTARALKPKKKA